jgi:predicted permease
MDQSIQILNRVLPIILLLALGYTLRRSRFLGDATIDDLRKIVVNLAMPSVLLLSFLEIELQPAYLFIFVAIVLLCLGLFAPGR